MKNSNKKGFTIVELVIVIAVIAILAAILIPTFSSIVNKANEAVDLQEAKNLNTILTTAEDGETPTFTKVVKALQDGGYLIANLNPTSKDWVYVWESESNQIIIVNKTTFEVVYHGKELKNNTIGATWYLVCHDEELAASFRAKGAKVSVVVGTPEFTIAEGETIQTTLNNANDGDYIVLAGDVEFDSNESQVNITKSLTFVSLDGSAIIAEKSVKVASNKDVTFQNVTFKDQTSAQNTASCFYASNTTSKIVFDGCTFVNPQWEGVQITPASDTAEIVIKNCTFVVDANGSHMHSGTTVKGNHRMLHIQAPNDSGLNVKITLTNNTFIGTDLVDNSVIDIDYVDYSKCITAYGNVFKKADGTLVSSVNELNSEAIFICKTYVSSRDVMSDADAFALMTKSK